MTRKSVYLAALGIGSAAAVWAARKMGRLLDNGAVRLAAVSDTERTPGTRTTPVPPDSVTVTTVTTGDPASNLPARTWVVDNGADWDGAPGELVVLPRAGAAPGRERK